LVVLGSGALAGALPAAAAATGLRRPVAKILNAAVWSASFVRVMGSNGPTAYPTGEEVGAPDGDPNLSQSLSVY
jgi:hypothetical protein